jgi:FKBP-type peptidyl-prolyl cis-trans isomerase
MVSIQMCPILNGSWMYLGTGFTAPQASFEKDRPLMAAMIAGYRVNQEVAWQRMQERNRQTQAMMNQMNDATNAAMQRNHDQFMHDQNQRFADGQAAHAEQMAGYQRHNDQFNADMLQRSRNNADFVETIKGTRTVYDTETGQTATVDLNYSTAVVNQLNQATLDPNRFVEIPLRDEMYPVTGK